MTRTLRTALTALLIIGLVTGGAGAAAADTGMDIDMSDDDSLDIDDSTIIIIDKSDNDFINFGLNLLS
jgi:hypothetical protein